MWTSPEGEVEGGMEGQGMEVLLSAGGERVPGAGESYLHQGLQKVPSSCYCSMICLGGGGFSHPYGSSHICTPPLLKS